MNLEDVDRDSGGSATSIYTIDLTKDFSLDMDANIIGDKTANGFNISLIPESSFGSVENNSSISGVDIPNAIFTAFKFWSSSSSATSTPTAFAQTMNKGYTNEKGEVKTVNQKKVTSYRFTGC